MNMTPPGGKTIDLPGEGCGQQPKRREALPENDRSSGQAGFSRIAPHSLFETTSMRLDDLLHHIAQGLLALPAFARPFLWGSREAAWLLDSLFHGYPAGVCIFWEYRPPALYRAIGRDFCRRPPALLLADGRQRLTALYCALRGALPSAEGQGAARVQVAFSPLAAVFTPCGTKTRDNPEYIPDIAGLWRTPSSSRKIAQAYLVRLGRAMRLDEDAQERACLNIDRLLDMLHYCFPILELPARLSEHEVRAIFSRVNQNARQDQRPPRRSAVPNPALHPSGKPPGQAKTLRRRLSEEPRLIVKNSVPAGSAFFPPPPPALAAAGPRPAENQKTNDPPLREPEHLGPPQVFPARSFVAL